MSATAQPVGRMRPDKDVLAQFADAVFRYADPKSMICFRAFEDGGGSKPVLSPTAPGMWVSAKERDYAVGIGATVASAHYRSACFCPPTATFNYEKARPGSARECDVANGLVLSVDCDGASGEAWTTLTALLGEPTITVTSGGEWVDPETGEVQPKVHLHWRLKADSVTRTPEEHAKLKQARAFACAIVGGDPSNVPLSHPLRWPGSVHRKAAPRLAEIAATSDTELDLTAALAVLKGAYTGPALDFSTRPASEVSDPATVADIASALEQIPNADLDWDAWNWVGMAAWRGSNGEAFNAFDAWSRKSAKYDPAETLTRWEHYSGARPTLIGAGTLFKMANEAAGSDWVRPSNVHNLWTPEELAAIVGRGAPEPPDDAWDGWAVGTSGGSVNGEAEAEAEPEAEREESEPPGPKARSKLLTWFGASKPVSIRWLVQGMLPEKGVAIIAGQHGAGKTFVALDLAVAVMTGGGFADRQVSRRGGVLFLAAEGENEIDDRLLAVVHGKVNGPQITPDVGEFFKAHGGNPRNFAGLFPDLKPLEPYPFARQSLEVPKLTVPSALHELRKHVQAASEEMAEYFNGTPLVLIVIDTLSAAASFLDENSASETQRVMNVCAQLSRETRALVVVVDHFGKSAETGVRGSSAKGAAADAILAVMADRDASGAVTGRRMSIQKLRGGATGTVKPFELRSADIDGVGGTNCFVGWTDRSTEIEPDEAAVVAEADTGLALLKAMIANPNGKQGEWATAIGKSRPLVGKKLVALKGERLVECVLSRWSVTTKGQNEAALRV